MLVIDPSIYPKVTDPELVATLALAQDLPWEPDHERVYVYYDGPLSGEYTSPTDGESFLVNMLDHQLPDTQWLITPVSNAFLTDVRSGEVTFRNGLKGPEGFVYLFTQYWRTPSGNEETLIVKMPSQDLKDSHLPQEGYTVRGNYWGDTLSIELPKLEEGTEYELEAIRKTLTTTFESKRARKIVAHELLRRAQLIYQREGFYLEPGTDIVVREAVRLGISFLEPEDFDKTNRFLCFYPNSQGAAFEALFEKTLWHPELSDVIMGNVVGIARHAILPNHQIPPDYNRDNVKRITSALGILGILDHPDFNTHIQTILTHESKWFKREVYRKLEDALYYDSSTPCPAERGFPPRKYLDRLREARQKLKDSISPTFGKALSF